MTNEENLTKSSSEMVEGVERPSELISEDRVKAIIKHQKGKRDSLVDKMINLMIQSNKYLNESNTKAYEQDLDKYSQDLEAYTKALEKYLSQQERLTSGEAKENVGELVDKPIEPVPPTEPTLLPEYLGLVSWKALNYVLLRASAYPSKEEQLDMQFHDFETWKSTIQAIKTKYPKGEYI